MSTRLPKTDLQISPVRGRLDPESVNGWRYLQCTETPNELRVLIPPVCASDYTLLLRAEVLELQLADKEANWTRIIYVRRLKDRLIHKCQRLARNTPVSPEIGSSSAFRTLVAPQDFRVKEIARWVKEETLPARDAIHVHESTSSNPPPTATERRSTSPTKPSKPLSSYLTHRPTTSLLARLKSPEPLPHILRSRLNTVPASVIASDAVDEDPLSSDYDDGDSTSDPQDDDDNQTVTAQPMPEPEVPVEMPVPTVPVDIEESPAAPIPMPEPEIPESEAASSIVFPLPRPLARRRSSLRRMSTGDDFVSKRVTWALDKDWLEHVSAYNTAAKELRDTDVLYKGALATYQTDLTTLTDLSASLSTTISSLTNQLTLLTTLQTSVQAQEELLRNRATDLERTVTSYREKTDKIMTETERVMDYCLKKKDPHV